MTNRKLWENTVNFTLQLSESLEKPFVKKMKFSIIHKIHVNYLSALTKNMHTYEGRAKDKTLYKLKK